jgi:hypothetical protein
MAFNLQDALRGLSLISSCSPEISSVSCGQAYQVSCLPLNSSKMTQAQWMRRVMYLNTTFGVQQPGPQCPNTIRTLNYIVSATVNPPAHHEGWMLSGQETVFCWAPVP